MKYENANDILPKDLLEQVQKIAGGRLLYMTFRARSKKNSPTCFPCLTKSAKR